MEAILIAVDAIVGCAIVIIGMWRWIRTLWLALLLQEDAPMGPPFEEESDPQFPFSDFEIFQLHARPLELTTATLDSLGTAGATLLAVPAALFLFVAERPEQRASPFAYALIGLAVVSCIYTFAIGYVVNLPWRPAPAQHRRVRLDGSLDMKRFMILYARYGVAAIPAVLEQLIGENAYATKVRDRKRFTIGIAMVLSLIAAGVVGVQSANYHDDARDAPIPGAVSAPSACPPSGGCKPPLSRARTW